MLTDRGDDDEMEDLMAEQDDLIDDVDLRLDRHAGGEDGEEEVSFFAAFFAGNHTRCR